MRTLRRSGPEPTGKLQFQRTAGPRSRGQVEAASGHARGAKKPDSITEITRTICARGEHFQPGQAAFSEIAATSFGKAPHSSVSIRGEAFFRKSFHAETQSREEDVSPENELSSGLR